MMSWLTEVIVHAHIMYTLTCALPPDSTLTVQNVTRALTGMAYDRGFSSNLGVPDSILNDILHRYSADDQRNLAVVEHYLHYAPGASWSHLAGELYYYKKEGALQHVQRYVQRPAGMASLLITCVYLLITIIKHQLFFVALFGLQNVHVRPTHVH